MTPSAPETTSFRAALARITWMFLGPLAAFVAGVGLFVQHHGVLSFGDVPFFLAVGAILVGRWVEYRGGNAQSATGEPVTDAHVRRYLIAVSACALLVWAAALLLRGLH